MAAAVAREHGACLCRRRRQRRSATLWTGSQKPYYVRTGCAQLTGLKPANVHAKWIVGPGSYGRNDAGDAAHDAALLSKLTGQPVRVQYMRHDGTAWDPKGPAAVYRGRAGLDAAGNVIAYEFFGKGFSRFDVSPRESTPNETLVGQLTKWPGKPIVMFQTPSETTFRQQAPRRGKPYRRCSIALRRCAPGTSAIRSAPKRILRANHSSTRSRTRQAPIRSLSGCATSLIRAMRRQ